MAVDQRDLDILAVELAAKNQSIGHFDLNHLYQATNEKVLNIAHFLRIASPAALPDSTGTNTTSQFISSPSSEYIISCRTGMSAGISSMV
jgi:hypothetical protein